MFTLKNQILLVIAPHVDDEVIGCGGLIKKIKDLKGKVYVLFLSVGDTQDFSEKGFSTGKERLRELDLVANFFHYDNYHLAFSGNDSHLKLDLLGQKKLMEIIEQKTSVSINNIKPTIVAFPSPLSYNQDHRITAFATHAALRSKSHSFIPYALSYEQAADTWALQNQQQPNLFIPLSKKQFEAKLEGLKLYQSQMRSFPNLRSPETLRALAVLRGSQSGTSFAEGFTSYRTILS